MFNPTMLHSLYRKMCALALMLLSVCMLLSVPLAQAQPQGGGGFDHSATSFPLTGSHELVRCETCHIKGIFKTTPKVCATCHVVGNQRDAVAPSAKHIAISNPPFPTPLACDACHSTSTFSATQFNHSMVQQGFCQVCHNGTRAQGMPANHFPTTNSCDQCHSTLGWVYVPLFSHDGVDFTVWTCARCHDGRIAKGMTANHLPRSNSALCGSCHINSTLNGFTSFTGGQIDHTGLTTGCADCHGPSITASSFAGISSIVVMPPTSPAGASSHIPSSTTCESCHLGSLPVGLLPANAALKPPGSLFATPAPSTAQIHAGVTGGCNSCHETGMVWMSMSAYPIAPSVLGASGTQYIGFQTRPVTAASTYSVADAAHPTSGDCSQCHAGTAYFSGTPKPDNHIPYASTASCTVCHTSSDYSVLPTLAAVHANAQSTTANCAQCHGSAAASFAIPAANFTIVGLPDLHIPTTAACESCHVGTGSSIVTTPVPNGAKFSGSQMSHVGITTNCAACHGPSITGTSFTGISKIVVMPATSPAGASSHIPSSTTCETCHLGTTPANMVAASSTKTAPGTLFASPAPTTAQIHTGVTGGCNSCHDTGMAWMSVNVSAYAIAPTVLTSGAKYTGFQTRPVAAASTYSVADPAHPSTGDCSQCHSGTDYFSATPLPSNHIPYATAAQCSSCHTTPGDFATTPTLTNIHANAQSTTTNCAQCHGSAAASFAIPAVGFSIVGLPSAHVPTSAACESCHVGTGSSMATTPVLNGAKFSGSLMSHTGITTNCEACHGPSITASSFTGISKIVVMPATSPAGASSHIPSGNSCETCHLGTTPAGLIAASATKTAPGTLFLNPTPTNTQIHTGITSGCNSCHDTGMAWMGMGASLYALSPSKLTTGTTQYFGFQTRPVTAASTYSVADSAHPTTGDCSACHTGTAYFSATPVPSNHIPYASGAQCTACHTSTDYATLPTLTNIHANAPSTTANCAQCHGSTAASFAIPAANFTIVGLPATHMPTSAACESCHVGTGSSIAATPVLDGAKFSGSLMSHTGITSNCVSCHGPTITGASFAGVSKIVVMPAVTPAGASAHIPSSTTCETCHLGTTPAGLIAASATKTAPGTAFLTPAPTTAQIHTGITGGCNSCHDTGMVWMSVNVSAYAIAPTAMSTTATQYTGFQTRPVTAASTYSVADAAHPSSGDCSACHTGTDYFSSIVKPANHIPYLTTAACTACHTTAVYSAMPTLTNIHANAQSTSSNCTQCHGSNVRFYDIPAANFAIVGLPSLHIPTSAACESCHVGTGSSMATTPVLDGAKFTGSLMSHTGITTNCVACHGPTITGASFAGVSKIVVMPAVTPAGASSHIPSGNTCETCHLGTTPAGLIAASATKTAPGTAFLTPAPTTAQIHTGITGGCNSCHDTGMVWMSVGQYPIAPTVLTNGAQYTGFHTRPVTAASTYSVADAAHPAGDCSTCHTGTDYFSGNIKPANHIPYLSTALCTACHTSTDFSVLPTLTNIHANAQSTTSNCAQCHGSAAASFAIPAANFTIVGLPATHIPTSAACESCHVGTGSSMATTPVLNGAKFSGSLMSHAGITTGCVTCHVASGTTANFAGITKIVGMPATSPVGASSHIPSSTTCETCHLGTTPAGMVAASATKTAPGTAFLTPVPTTAMIHTNITGGCNSCHDTGYVWMDMSQYPIAPTTMGTSTTQYTGFHTRPVTAASTYSVADAAHPAGDCSQCHSGTAYFSGAAKPTGHIPTTLTCSTCHIVAGDYSVAGLASLTILHTGITTGCITCHTAGTGKGPFAGCTTVATCTSPPPVTYQPKVMPLLAGGSPTSPSSSTHVPAAGVACELCHASVTAFSGMNMKSNTAAHVAVGSVTCITCHEGTPKYVWYGVTMKTEPVGHQGRKAGQDCIPCHNKSYSQFSGGAARVRPLMRGAAGTISQRFLPGIGLNAGLLAGDTSVFSHAGVTPGQCVTCHNGQVASGLPPVHKQTRMSCDSCHRTTAWLPAQFSHQGVLQGQCLTCHNSVTASGRPAGHFVTGRSCDSCHKTVAWLPVSYTHVSPLYQAPAGNPNCVSCHVTNGEIIPRQMRGNNRPRPVPVHTGP